MKQHPSITLTLSAAYQSSTIKVMTRSSVTSALRSASWTCRQCQRGSKRLQNIQRSTFTTCSSPKAQDLIKAAPEIDFGAFPPSRPARIIPSSPSYFTAFPNFNDDFLMLQNLVVRNSKVPQLPADKTPQMIWLRLSQYRNVSSEPITAHKYQVLLRMVTRLNRIHPQLRSDEVKAAILKFRRPGSEDIEKPKPKQLDELGRSVGVGRRKAASARVFLVEGTGEVLVNGMNLVAKFPRLHDRESALWPLKITSRLSKYNVFALVAGGGITGQAEAITLGLARALIVQEPALKAILRRAGCVTRDRRRVERKKPGRVKARKMPTWVKR